MATRALMTVAVDTADKHSDAAIKDLIHHIPGTHLLDSTVLKAQVADFEWDADADPTMLPMTQDQARSLMDESGYLTVVVMVDQDLYLQFAGFANTVGADTHEDLAHRQAFAFGLPHDCSITVVGVCGSDFVVSYTTNVAEYV